MDIHIEELVIGYIIAIPLSSLLFLAFVKAHDRRRKRRRRKKGIEL